MVGEAEPDESRHEAGPTTAHSATYPTTNATTDRCLRDQRLRSPTARTCGAATGSIIASTISTQWVQPSDHDAAKPERPTDIAIAGGSSRSVRPRTAAATAYTHHSGCQARSGGAREQPTTGATGCARTAISRPSPRPGGPQVRPRAARTRVRRGASAGGAPGTSVLKLTLMRASSQRPSSSSRSRTSVMSKTAVRPSPACSSLVCEVSARPNVENDPARSSG